MSKCKRCFKDTVCTIVSMFDTQEICLDCKEKEVAHPKYDEACKVEAQQVKDGNYNFLGVGKPADL